MTKATRAQYTLEFKQEAVQMVESGQSIAAAARSLGVVERTLYNWVKAQREGRRKGPAHKSVPSKWTMSGHEHSRLGRRAPRSEHLQMSPGPALVPPSR